MVYNAGTTSKKKAMLRRITPERKKCRRPRQWHFVTRNFPTTAVSGLKGRSWVVRERASCLLLAGPLSFFLYSWRTRPDSYKPKFTSYLLQWHLRRPVFVYLFRFDPVYATLGEGENAAGGSVAIRLCNDLGEPVVYFFRSFRLSVSWFFFFFFSSGIARGGQVSVIEPCERSRVTQGRRHRTRIIMSWMCEENTSNFNNRLFFYSR